MKKIVKRKKIVKNFPIKNVTQMKNSHFSSNYDNSGRPLLLGGEERTQQTNFVNLKTNSCTPASNDSDVKITSVYQKRNPKSNYENLSQTSKLEQSKYEGLNCQSETSNEYHVIRSTNKYQHKAATKRKRETGGSHFIFFRVFTDRHITKNETFAYTVYVNVLSQSPEINYISLHSDGACADDKVKKK